MALQEAHGLLQPAEDAPLPSLGQLARRELRHDGGPVLPLGSEDLLRPLEVDIRGLAPEDLLLAGGVKPPQGTT